MSRDVMVGQGRPVGVVVQPCASVPRTGGQEGNDPVRSHQLPDIAPRRPPVLELTMKRLRGGFDLGPFGQLDRCSPRRSKGHSLILLNSGRKVPKFGVYQ